MSTTTYFLCRNKKKYQYISDEKSVLSGAMEPITNIQLTLVISTSKGLYETLRDIRTLTYQLCGIEENN